MAIEKVKEYFKKYRLENSILEFDVSSATVELASIAVGCEPAKIAKTLSFYGNINPMLIVVAGDAKIDNHKFKETFGFKAKMLCFDDVEPLIGHAVGGVCPFAINENVEVYLDASLTRFEHVYPACGSSNSAIKLSIKELEQYSNFKKWVDVCKLSEENH